MQVQNFALGEAAVSCGLRRAVPGQDHRAGWTLPGKMALGGPGKDPRPGWGPDSEMGPTAERWRRARILEPLPAAESRL